MAVITISRQFGAGGKTLGQLIANKLNYTLISEEIVEKVAEKAKVSVDWVQDIEKEAGGTLQKFMSGLISKSYVERILGKDRGYLDEDKYVETLREVITQLAKDDNIVFVGRGGQYILENHPRAFHILLIAEKLDRINFMKKNYKLSYGEATQVVETMGKRRANLYKKFGKKDFDQPELYHIVLNMSKLSMEEASDFVYRMVADLVCHLAE
ncbi:AAA family ATPase [Desulfococcus sp.]|uniref:cytidylate kinase-like family protein n=1 Tax=Desulfococcus sp. TaxID=2025834 RepID=UPI003593AC74